MTRVLQRNFILLLLLALGMTARAAMEGDLPSRDVLVFKDGDRLHGQLLRQEGNLLIFKSDRFGEQRVSADLAVVIKGEKPAESVAKAPATAPATPGVQPAAPAVAAKAAEQAKTEQVEAEQVSVWERFSPAVLTAKVREFFGPWKGRVAFSTEIISDTADRTTMSLEGRLSRKWTRDELQLNARFDYAETNNLTTTDMVKADGLWRHNFSKNKNAFTQYRPTVEWNRANFRSGRPADYVLLQQEIGAGINLLTSPARKLRVGVSENLFDVWTTSAPTSHTSRTAESAFVETELKLPWGLLLTDRGVYYYSFSSKADGWENRVELTKKFTETLSTAIRHELRRGSPDGKAQDYDRLKLLLGLDF